MKRFVFILTAVILTSSCEMVLDVEVPFEGKQVTANAFFNPDSLWSVQLNLNRNVLDEYPFDEVDNAEVIIYKGAEAIDTLHNAGHGRYRSDNERPEHGETYSLSVRTAAHGNVKGSSSIPRPAVITGMEMYESASHQSTMVQVSLRDDGSETNFYELYIELERDYYNYDTREVESRGSRIQLTSEDPSIQNDNEPYSSSVVFRDAFFNGRETEFTFTLSGGGLSYHGGTRVVLRTLSEDAYNYLRTARLQEATSGDPFAEPVNVYNNVQNGFGIFAGYTATAYTRSSRKPVIAAFTPASGKAGDHIVITGENFIGSTGADTDVAFTGPQGWIGAEIVEVTPTRIEVIVPAAAVTGKIFVINGRLTASGSEFIVME